MQPLAGSASPPSCPGCMRLPRPHAVGNPLERSRVRRPRGAPSPQAPRRARRGWNPAPSRTRSRPQRRSDAPEEAQTESPRALLRLATSGTHPGTTRRASLRPRCGESPDRLASTAPVGASRILPRCTHAPSSRRSSPGLLRPAGEPPSTLDVGRVDGTASRHPFPAANQREGVGQQRAGHRLDRHGLRCLEGTLRAA